MRIQGGPGPEAPPCVRTRFHGVIEIVENEKEGKMGPSFEFHGYFSKFLLGI